MKVEECPAGPEMDAAVAKALGCDVALEMHEGRLTAFCHCEWRKHESPTTYVPYMLKRYSRGTEAALELAAPLLQDGYVLAWIEDDGWVVGTPNIKRGWDGDFWVEYEPLAIGETIPLAVCRAFLKANGVEEIECLNFTANGKIGEKPK